MILLCIVGPTAAGKTRMSVDVGRELRARGHGVEIVSCDSMAVYRRLDIVADKPSPEDRAEIPHHLIDVAEPTEDFTVVEYRTRARVVIDEIDERGGVPMLVGGSGLHFRAVVDELDFAPTSHEVRSRLEAEDPGQLYARLREADPETAKRLDPRNVRRVVRAVEVLELTGRAPSEQRRGWERAGQRYALTAVGLTWDRDELLRRATERVERELRAGLVDEVRAVLPGGLSRTARQALGVKEIVPFLEGKLALEAATEKLVRNTKNFVRRQLSWFKPDPRVEWVNASERGWDGARLTILDCFAQALESQS